MIVQVIYTPKPSISPTVPVIEIQATVYFLSSAVVPELVTIGADSTNQVFVVNALGMGSVTVTGWTGISHVVFGFAYTAGDGSLEESVAEAVMYGEGVQADLVMAYPTSPSASSVFLPVFDSRALLATPANADFVRIRNSSIPAALFAGWNKGSP